MFSKSCHHFFAGSKSCWVTSRRFCVCSSFSRHGTNLATVFCRLRFSVKSSLHEVLEVRSSLATYRSYRFGRMILRIFSTRCSSVWWAWAIFDRISAVFKPFVPFVSWVRLTISLLHACLKNLRYLCKNFHRLNKIWPTRCSWKSDIFKHSKNCGIHQTVALL